MAVFPPLSQPSLRSMAPLPYVVRRSLRSTVRLHKYRCGSLLVPGAAPFTRGTLALICAVDPIEAAPATAREAAARFRTDGAGGSSAGYTTPSEGQATRHHLHARAQHIQHRSNSTPAQSTAYPAQRSKI
jgi:hypothetical protein